MSDIVRIQVHKSLQKVLEELRLKIAGDMKIKYGLDEITVPRTLSSQILAAKMKGNTTLNVKIRKTSLNKGILEIV